MKLKEVFSKIIKTVIYWGIIGFFLWLLYQNAGDYYTILTTLKSANYVSFAWGFLLAIGNTALLTSVYRINFKIFQNDISIGSLLLEIFAFSFVTISNPLGFSGAQAITIQRFVKKGYSYLSIFFGFFSTQLAMSIGYFPILGLAVWYLNSRGQLTNYEIYAAQILLIVNVLVIIFLTVLLVTPIFSIKVTKFFANISNILVRKIIGRSLVNTENLTSKIKDIQENSLRFDKYFFTFSKSALVSLIHHLINILVLYFAFTSFGYMPDWQVLISIYAVIVLFTIVSPTPLGIGIVEGLAHLAAISIGVGSEVALVSILSYRLMVVWIPGLIGLIVFRKLKKQL